MTVEEFFKHRGWSGTLHLFKDAEDYGKLQYNQALEDAAESAKTDCKNISDEWGMNTYMSHTVDKQSILKLKKL